MTGPYSAEFPALGTTARVLVTEEAALGPATALLRTRLAELDQACSRFRTDSEISALHRSAGREVRVSPLLADALSAALRASWLTGGLVDPTVGGSMAALGYDRDFASVADGPELSPVPAPGTHRVLFDPATRTVVLLRGVFLDLGATAKAFAADRTAVEIARRAGCGVLVNLGGDLAVHGPAPEGGWQVAIGDDHADAADQSGPTITLTSGGLATSGVARRTWRRGDRTVHHIVDPRTGKPAGPCWRTVSVAAKSCLDANTASTASVVLGTAAPDWLTSRGLPARLVSSRGAVATTAGWPQDRKVRAS
ncbi:FAD:protein FMN transferase [Amycolatopsis benzoatilytica]|uniref:FAD:protein FMN transferase n=1 Tax=Amycolatopsis benzoatilytica TaxID=346045 RepID=UPI00036C930E|nr:FAD:protein FMN transferase [Amycolatopsis benzoatilytica]